MDYFLIFIFGTIIGSFLNVVILRLNTGESIINGRSRCFSCGKKLSWQELVPVLSFVVQKGKCRGCKSKISAQYPIIEFLTGVIFLIIFNFSARGGSALGGQFSLFYYWLIFSLLVIISVYDIRHQIIPNKLVYLFNALAFLNLFQVSSFRFQNFDIKSFLVGLTLFVFFSSLWLISKGRWMGLGDAKLALGIPWLLGACGGIWAFAFSFWIGAIIGIILLFLTKNRYSMKSRIPFGPFLAIGALLAFFLNGIISCILV